MAAADEDHDRAHELRTLGEILPLEEILRRFSAQAGEVRVLEAELKKVEQGYAYEIEFLDAKGLVWEQWLDAQTGAPLGPAVEE